MDYKYYVIRYMSTCLDKNYYKETIIKSEKDLEMGAHIIVEKIGQGIFLGEVLREMDEDIIPKNVFYRYVQDVDLSNYFEEKAKEQKRKELEEKMEQEYARIDKMSKWEFYASKDATFNKLLEEYKNI